MEVKPGYKQTEVGVIPEVWRDCDISDLCQLQRGFDLTEATRKRGDIPVYSSSGLSYFHNEARLQPPAVITGRKGMLGRVYFVEEPCWPHDTTLWVKDFKGNHPRFVALFLGQFKLERFDAATSVPTLNRNNVVGIPIKLPPLPEQRAIAGALSDVDGLLGGLDRLIAKKRDLKQAAMQQLLTGQTRLPGFHGEWEVKRLDALADIRSGGTPSTSEPRFWDGNIPWCTPTDITALSGHKYLGETARMISLLGLKASSAEMIPAHSVVMTSRATIGECAINAVPVSTNQGFKNFVPFATTDVDFLYYLLTTQKQGFISLCGGSTFLEIGKTQLSAYKVRLPCMKAEQTAIATVLTEMDGELAVLEQRREKTRALKQAMMQELLTGRTRLVQ
jgi:type I restriction enzyme S subunit